MARICHHLGDPRYAPRGRLIILKLDPRCRVPRRHHVNDEQHEGCTTLPAASAISAVLHRCEAGFAMGTAMSPPRYASASVERRGSLLELLRRRMRADGSGDGRPLGEESAAGP